LLAVEVGGPTLELEGVSEIEPATDPPLAGGAAELEWSPATAGEGWSWSRSETGSGELVMENLSSDGYLEIATAAVEPGRKYTLHFEARTIGQIPHHADLGLVMTDHRGWEVTRSANGLTGLQYLDGWHELQLPLVSRSDATAFSIVLFLRGVSEPASARLELRSTRLVLEPTAAPYAALTAAASLDIAGTKLYLIVINKHHQDAIQTTVDVDGVFIFDAHAWTVTGPALASTNLAAPLVSETVSGEQVPVASRHGFAYTLPPRSMTAFELDCGAVQRPVRTARGRASRP
jgi:hypothetical protein